MTSVPSLEGVVAWSLSESSTSMVLADSVSPLLSLLQKPWGYLMSIIKPVLTVMQKSHATLMPLTMHILTSDQKGKETLKTLYYSDWSLNDVAT